MKNIDSNPFKIELFQCNDIYVNDPDIFPGEDRHHFVENGEAMVCTVSMDEINSIGHFFVTHKLGSKDNKRFVVLYSTDESGQLYVAAAWRNLIGIYVSKDNLKDYIALPPLALKAKVISASDSKIKLSVEWGEARHGFLGLKLIKQLDHYNVTLKRDINDVWRVSFNYKWIPVKDNE